MGFVLNDWLLPHSTYVITNYCYGSGAGGSTQLTQKPTIGHGPELISSTYHPHNLPPQDAF